jgi:hypothetical protein
MNRLIPGRGPRNGRQGEPPGIKRGPGRGLAENNIGNGNGPLHNLAKLREQATRRQRRRRMAGPRAFFEFIDELDRHFDIPDIDRRLDRYADLDPDILRSLGANKFPAPVTRLVVSER